MFLGKEIRILLKGKARDSLFELKKRNDKEAISIINSINRIIDTEKMLLHFRGAQKLQTPSVALARVFDILKQNPQYGDPIAKDLIPDEFKKQGVCNLYRVELSNFWRMLYSLEGNKLEIFVFILSISDHPTYNKLFGYKKS